MSFKETPDKEEPDEFQRVVCDKEDVGLVLRKDGSIEFFGNIDTENFPQNQVLLSKLVSNLNYFGYSVFPYTMVRQKSTYMN